MAACWEEPMTAVPFPDTQFHSIATLRDEHATTFHPPTPPLPRVTPGVNLPRYYTLSLRLSLSPLLYFFSSCRSLSGFSRVRLCLCLSICVFICFAHIHRRRMLLSWLHRLSRQWEEINPPPPPLQQTFKSVLGIQRHTAYCICWTILGWKHNLKWILTDTDICWENVWVYKGCRLIWGWFCLSSE